MKASETDLIDALKQQFPYMPEYHQAAKDIVEDVLPFIREHGNDQHLQALRYLLQPDRSIAFRVHWEDDDGHFHSNRGYRVQFNNALGPYKGGLRFHPSVDASVLHFLGLEQTFKNSLTGLPMGGAKGGADFSPKGRSDAEIRRFCQAFMTELARHIGPDTDVPAGDIGVGSREIAHMFHQYKAITGHFSGVLTGKDPIFGGSDCREEATGYGCVYFAEAALTEADDTLEDKVCCVSGAGNVALHTADMLLREGAKVISLSDSQGVLQAQQGLTETQLADIKQRRAQRERLRDIADNKTLCFIDDAKPWSFECDLAFACATQNELVLEDAKALAQNGCRWLFEGANMPCTADAQHYLREHQVIIGPSKAVNAGGVAVSGLEISQNRARLPWDAERVDQTLRDIMNDIHQQCLAHGKQEQHIDYKRGANIAAFLRLSRALTLYGVV